MIGNLIIAIAIAAVALLSEWIMTRRKAPPVQRKKWPEVIG